MTDLLVDSQKDIAVELDAETSLGNRMECTGKCHNGPIDDSPRAIKNADEHDPEAPAAFLYICLTCDSQWALCAKKVSVLLTHIAIGKEFFKCNVCDQRIPVEKTMFIPLK